MFHTIQVLLVLKIGLYKNIINLGFTIEAGLGKNPLPLSQFEEIYKDNLGILVLSAT